MNVALWVGQALLAVVFVYSGSLKLSQSRQRLIDMGQTGASVFPLPLLRFVACCELLGVLGVILPWLTHTVVVLTPLAAVGFAVVMIGAVAAHARLREPRNVLATSLILVLALVVAAGRFMEMAS